MWGAALVVCWVTIVMQMSCIVCRAFWLVKRIYCLEIGNILERGSVWSEAFGRGRKYANEGWCHEVRRRDTWGLCNSHWRQTRRPTNPLDNGRINRGKIKLAKGFPSEKKRKEYSALTKRSLLNKNKMVLLKRNGKLIFLVLEIGTNTMYPCDPG